MIGEMTSGVESVPATPDDDDGSSLPAASACPQKNGSGAAAAAFVATATSPRTAKIAKIAAINVARGGDDVNDNMEGNVIVSSPQKMEEGTGADNSAVATESGAGECREAAGQPSDQPTTGTEAPNKTTADSSQNQGYLGGSHTASHPQNPHASMFHPMFSQYPMLHPQFQQMTPQQQQVLLFQQHMLMQQMTQQYIQDQVFQQSRNQAATTGASQNQSTNAAAQNYQAQQMAQQSIIQQQLLQQSIQQQLLQQTHYQTAVASAASTFQNYPSQPALNSQGLGQGPTNAPFLQAPPHLNIMHPLYWNHQNPQGIEAIYQADESNYQNHHDSDDDDDDSPDRPSQKLLRLVEDHHWVAALQRITTHPRETQEVGIQGRTPLHVACDHDAPPAMVQAILSAWPEGAERVGTSHMNPLHITCSSPHASVDVVRVLLAGCRDSLMITGAKDVDGDTPLHAACRCAAPMDVLVTLLQANLITVTWKDYEGLNPMMRLWVRYFVLVGEQIISNIKQPSDLTSDLVEAWQKSLLLLQVMSAMERRGTAPVDNGHDSEQKQQHAAPFRAVHAASSVDCPRCVVRIARVLFPQELLNRDETNRLPIHIAAAAPVYAVHDLRGEGFTIDDAMLDAENPEQRAARSKKKESKYKEPSVIDILLGGAPASASEHDCHGQLPLHVAIMRGKTLDEGVGALVEAYPDALTTPDNQTNLYPFMLAASVGRGRGHCTTIYALLRAAPELVHMALSGDILEDKESEKPGKRPRAGKIDS